MFADVMPGIVYGFAAAVTPGPLSAFLLSQAVTAGWKRTLPATFSPLLSDGPVALLVLAVLSQVPSSLVRYLRLFGGAFILYLAFEAWKSWRNSGAQNETGGEGARNNLLKAAIVNWLNPNVYISWSIIVGPMFLHGWQKAPVIGAGLVLGFYLTLIATMIGMVIVFASAGALGPKIRRSLIGISSLALAALGIYQLWLGLT
jgi:threonine/homoserine/homoserine lactone efflux protein